VLGNDPIDSASRTRRLALVLAVAAALVLVGAFALRPKRAFYECTDPTPLIAALVPTDGALIHEETPGLFDGACTASFARSYATGASELEITKGLDEIAEKLGFSRVAMRPDSTWWCERARPKRSHQFVRDDLLLRFVVEPLPYPYGKGQTLTSAQARYGVYVALRNFDQERLVECPAARIEH
jgi:hypothetical protein